jgi:hypothetical protein
MRLRYFGEILGRLVRGGGSIMTFAVLRILALYVGWITVN